jgi:hypothetical protein
MDALEWVLEDADHSPLPTSPDISLPTIDDDVLQHIFEHLSQPNLSMDNQARALFAGSPAAWQSLAADAAASATCTRFSELFRPRFGAWRDACQDVVLEAICKPRLPADERSTTDAYEVDSADVDDTFAQRMAKQRAWFANSEVLPLHGRAFTDLHLRMVAPLLLRPAGLPPLRALLLQDNRLGDAALFALARAASRGALLSLETLNLGAQEPPPDEPDAALAERPPRFTAAGLGALLGATVSTYPAPAGRRAALSSLVRLLLPSLLLTDREAKAIAEAIAAGGVPSLETLRISNNRITDAGARALVYALPQVPNFARLEWHNNLVRGAIPLIQHICAHVTGRKVERLRGPGPADQGMPEEQAARLSLLAHIDGTTAGASPPFTVAHTPPLLMR